MMNIIKKLRISSNNALLLVAATGAMALTGCSDEIVPGGNNGLNEPEQKLESLNVTVNTDANSLSSLVTNYRNSRNLGSRAASELAFPGMPEVPTSYDVTLDEAFKGNPWALSIALPEGSTEADIPDIPTSNVNVYVPAGTYNSLPGSFYVNYTSTGYYDAEKQQYIAGLYVQKEITNPNYYIDGEVTIGGTGQDALMTINILNGGKFTDNSVLQSKTKVNIHEGGAILKASQSGDIVQIHGDLVSAAEINIPTVDINVQGNLYTSASITAKNVTLNGGKVYAGCAVTAVETVYFTGESELSVGYVKGKDIEFGSNLAMECLVRDGGYIEGTESIKVKNCSNSHIHAEDGDVGLLTTKNLECNSIDLGNTFQNLYIDYETLSGDNRLPDEAYFNNNCVINDSEGNLEFVRNDDHCAPVTVLPKPTPGDDGDDDPIEDIGSIEAPTHDHPISATCIFTDGNNGYASWHTRGTDFHGCVEHWSVANGEISLKAYLETQTIDFNHVIYADGRILVAGDDSKKGGIMGWINCEGGTFPTNNEATLNMRALYSYELDGNKYNSGSGNVILKNGNYYQTASIRGFESFVCDSLYKSTWFPAYGQLATYTFKPGATTDEWSRHTGKHIATDGQKVVMLTLVDRNDENAKAALSVYAANDYKFETLIASYIIESDVIAPVDGKNVVAIDGDDIFVCLGQGGVKHLKIAGTTMTEVKSFKLSGMSEEDLNATYKLTVKQSKEAAANGLAVDAQHVYIAYGGAGMIVLNRSDFSHYDHVRHSAGKSANYVNLGKDGYIYVAYGLSKIQVYAKKQQ